MRSQLKYKSSRTLSEARHILYIYIYVYIEYYVKTIKHAIKMLLYPLKKINNKR